MPYDAPIGLFGGSDGPNPPDVQESWAMVLLSLLFGDVELHMLFNSTCTQEDCT